MAATAAAPSKGFEWRTLLGPTHEWKPAEVSAPSTEERCELCGKPIGDRPFITNSAGEFPTHVACSSGGEPSAIGLRPARKSWRHLLQSLVTGWLACRHTGRRRSTGLFPKAICRLGEQHIARQCGGSLASPEDFFAGEKCLASSECSLLFVLCCFSSLPSWVCIWTDTLYRIRYSNQTRRAALWWPGISSENLFKHCFLKLTVCGFSRHL